MYANEKGAVTSPRLLEVIEWVVEDQYRVYMYWKKHENTWKPDSGHLLQCKESVLLWRCRISGYRFRKSQIKNALALANQKLVARIMSERLHG